MNGLRQLWRGGLRAVVGLSSATVFGQLLTAAVVPILTRLYPADAFGVFASFSGIAMAVLVVAGLRLEMAIPLQRHDPHARQLLTATLIVMAAMGLVSMVVVVAIHTAAMAGLMTFDARLGALLWWLPAFVVLAGAQRALVNFTLRAQRFADVARTRLVQPPATVFTQVVGGFLHWGERALALGFILGQTVGVLHLIRRAGGMNAVVGARPRPLRLRAMWRRHRRFPLLDTPAAFADTLGAHLPTIVLTMWFSPAAAAIYAVHQRLLLGPAAIVSQAVGQVLLGHVRHDRDAGSLGVSTRRLAGGLFVVAAAVASVGFFVVEPVMAIALGEAWTGTCGPVAFPFLVGVCGQCVYSPLSTMLVATDGQHINLTLHVLLLGLKGLVLAYAPGLEAAVIGVSLMNGLVYLIGSGAVLFHVARFEHRRRKD